MGIVHRSSTKSPRAIPKNLSIRFLVRLGAGVSWGVLLERLLGFEFDGETLAVLMADLKWRLHSEMSKNLAWNSPWPPAIVGLQSEMGKTKKGSIARIRWYRWLGGSGAERFNPMGKNAQSPVY
jgi:hypothetical protein